MGKIKRAFLWEIDALGVIVATTILALKYFRSGNDSVAAGFLIYAIGESVMLGGTAQPLDAMVPSFGAGAALWAVGLLLTSIPRGFAVWIRLVGIVAAILVLTFIGWIWNLMREH